MIEGWAQRQWEAIAKMPPVQQWHHVLCDPLHGGRLERIRQVFKCFQRTWKFSLCILGLSLGLLGCAVHYRGILLMFVVQKPLNLLINWLDRRGPGSLLYGRVQAVKAWHSHLPSCGKKVIKLAVALSQIGWNLWVWSRYIPSSLRIGRKVSFLGKWGWVGRYNYIWYLTSDIAFLNDFDSNRVREFRKNHPIVNLFVGWYLWRKLETLPVRTFGLALEGTFGLALEG